MGSKLNDEIGRFYWPTKSVNFCMTDDRFLLANFIGRQNRPTLSIVWHPVTLHSRQPNNKAANSIYARCVA